MPFLFGALIAAVPAAAQEEEGEPQDPPSFTLPEQRPATRDDVQGPVDERAGVQIRPRLIRPAQQPAEQNPPETRTLPETPVPGNTPNPAGAPPQASTIQEQGDEPVETLFDDLLRQSQAAPDTAGQTGATDPGLASEFPVDQPDDSSASASSGTDEWVDMLPPSPSIDLSGPEPAPPIAAFDPGQNEPASSIWYLLALTAAIGVTGLIGWLIWRKRTPRPLLLESNVASTAREHLAATNGRDERKRPAPLAGAPPPRRAATQGAQGAQSGGLEHLDLQLTIVSATRSVMTFSVGYRLTVSNRSDTAVRDLAITSQLTSAVRGRSNGPSAGKSRPLANVERIGPQQGHTITGTLELPMVDVLMIRQGSTPVFIPLLHLTLEGTGHKARSSSFVIGVPSATNPTRLHPVALDGNPGSVHNLRASPVRSLEPQQTA